MGRKPPASPSRLPPPTTGLFLFGVVVMVLLSRAETISAGEVEFDASRANDNTNRNDPIELVLEHRPKRSTQNPHPYTPGAAKRLLERQTLQPAPLVHPGPIAQTYMGLDCHSRFKFRALLDGYKLHNDTVPLCDNSAEFYAPVGVGTPPQYFYVQVDTGSALFAVPVQGCTGCARTTHRYVRDNSSTVVGFSCSDIFHCTAMRCYGNSFECGFHSQYQDKSYINGVVLKDKVTFGNKSFDGMFGAIHEAAGTFSASAEVDGILGLSYFSDLACLPNCVPPLWDSLVTAYTLPDVFTLDLPIINKGVAKLVLGGTGRSHIGNVEWTPIIQESYYVVDLKEIDVGGVPITYDPADLGQVIVDSGTTLLILPRNIFEALKEGFLSGDCNVLGICEHARRGDNIFNSCFDYTQFVHMTNNYALYPNISFKFLGVQVDLLPEQYLRTQLRSSLCVELAIAPIDNALTILGDTFMRDRVTVFDRANKRIGFTKAQAYEWKKPPAEEWVWWTIACLLGGFTLLFIASFAAFMYGARRHKRRRMPHYEPLALAEDVTDDDLIDFSDNASPQSSSSSVRLVRAAGFRGNMSSSEAATALLVNPAIPAAEDDDEELPAPPAVVETEPTVVDVVDTSSSA